MTKLTIHQKINLRTYCLNRLKVTYPAILLKSYERDLKEVNEYQQWCEMKQDTLNCIKSFENQKSKPYNKKNGGKI